MTSHLNTTNIKHNATSIELKLAHLTLRGIHLKASTPNNTPPIIALHGWQDNCHSFLPMLSHCGGEFDYYAFDWPGHGLSDWRSPDAHYYFIDYIDDLLQLIHVLEVDKVHLVGHSLGAMVASLFTACFSDKVASLQLIEGIGLLTCEDKNAKEVLLTSLKSRHKVREPRTYQQLDTLIQARLNVSDLTYAQAELIMQRNSKILNAGVQLSIDPRLKHYSAFRYTPNQADSLLSGIDVPCQLIVGESGYPEITQNKQRFAKHYPHLCEHTVAGGHHCHMSSAKTCCALIEDFIRQDPSHLL